MGVLRRAANSALRPFKLMLHRLRVDDPTTHKSLHHRHFEKCRVLSTRGDLLVALPKGGVVAEIGVADGDFSTEILRLNQPSVLHLIDAWQGDRYATGLDRVTSRFGQQIENGSVRIHRGRSMDVLASLPAKSCDWVYLDTSHDYAATLKELALCRKTVKSSGRIAGHDFCIGNPYSALPYGVIRAVYEFCEEHRWEMEYISLDADGYFSFCLRPIAAGAAQA